MLERDIQKRLIQYLKTVPNCWIVKVIQANINGCPDILMCFNGKFYGIEVKTDNGRTSAIQDLQIRRIREAGGVPVVIRSLDELKTFLNKETGHENRS